MDGSLQLDQGRTARGGGDTVKILKSGLMVEKKLHGACHRCGCEIECDRDEATVLHDRDSPMDGNLYVKCPECPNAFLWVMT